MTTTFTAIQVNNFTRGNGINTRLAVKYASPGVNINLASNLLGSVFDGGALALNDRILLKDQTNPIANGIYVVGSGAGATVRAPDLGPGDNASFVFLNCQLGTVNKNTSWVQVNVPPNVSTAVNSQPQSWVESAIFNYVANSLFYATSSTTLGTIPSVPNSILVTNGSGVPSWSNTPITASGEKNITISSMEIIAYSSNPLPIGYFDWANPKYYNLSMRSIYYESKVPAGKTLTISIYNETTDPTFLTPIGTQTLVGPIIAPASFNNFTFTMPGGTAVFNGYVGASLGTVANTTLTVTALTSGTISVGQYISGGTILSSTYIVAQLTGTPGGIGTYTVSQSQAAIPIVGIIGTGANARLAICVKKSPIGGHNPSVYGITMILAP